MRGPFGFLGRLKGTACPLPSLTRKMRGDIVYFISYKRGGVEEISLRCLYNRNFIGMQFELHKHRMRNACLCNFSFLKTVDSQSIAKHVFEPFPGLYLLSFFLFRKICFFLSLLFSSTSKRGKRREAAHEPPPAAPRKLEK